MGQLDGKVAVVTGASKGIGAGIARMLAAEGAAVVVNYASSKAGADKVVKTIEVGGGKAIAVQGDMSKAADVKRLFAAAKKAFGAIDILVNNAGVYKFQPFDEVAEDEFHRQFNTNVLGPLLTAQEAANHFNGDGGSIINISSIASRTPVPGSSVYAATKGALDSLTLVLSRELAARNIRVNAIAPGGVETEGHDTVGVKGSEFEAAMIANTPLGRIGRPDDIARVALFLASDQSRWLTGERINASGGFR